jgi:hypothetical protein
VVPKLRKKVKRGYNSNHLGRDAKECRGQQEDSEYFENGGNALTECTSKIKLFGGVVYDVVVPKDIVLVGDSVGPVTREV